MAHDFFLVIHLKFEIVLGLVIENGAWRNGRKEDRKKSGKSKRRKNNEQYTMVDLLVDILFWILKNLFPIQNSIYIMQGYWQIDQRHG